MSPRARAATVVVNHLLASLPRADRQRLIAQCDEVDLVESDVLRERGDRIDHVYFPIESFISLITPLDHQAGFEVGMIGSEGMLGISLVLGVDAAQQRALVRAVVPHCACRPSHFGASWHAARRCVACSTVMCMC